jgi:hypothetical protein
MGATDGPGETRDSSSTHSLGEGCSDVREIIYLG